MSTTEHLPAALVHAMGEARAEEIFDQLDRFSNQPNAVKGAAKRPSDPQLERAALEVFEALDPSAISRELDSIAMWGLLTLAARTDAAILEKLPAVIADTPKVASIRRAATKYRKEQAAGAGSVGPTPGTAATGAGASGSPVLPAKVSEVAGWVAAHPEASPQLFAPHSGQRAAARRSALRALGSMATPEALEVLAQYVSDRYSDADLAELHRAWGRFDRRDFAARMFGGGTGQVNLGVCSDIGGIGAAEGIESLEVIFERRADLEPLAECTELQTLKVHATGGSGLASVATIVGLPRLTHLELIGFTRDADLGVLRAAPIEQLYLHLDGADGSFLTEMPHLVGLKLSGGYEPHPDVEEPAGTPGARAAHPGLADTVIELVRKGVTVVLYRHQSWVLPLLESEPTGVVIEEAGGFVRLSRAA